MSKIGKLAAFATFVAGSGYGIVESVRNENEWRFRNFDREQEEQNTAKGLTKFTYGQNSLWALNQTNADRKAKKRGWI
jgi:hypothetical protein